ncbi:MAG: iron-containing alcohol dehydrogenase family protein [Oscillospiraceae bacterium]
MKLNNYSMTLPNYTIGEKAYEQIPTFCGRFGGKAVIVGGKTAMEKAAAKIRSNSGGINILDEVFYGGECSYENVDALMRNEKVKAADMIFAVGGGKATDTGKCLADKLGKPVFTFPTISSNCSCCTCVSIMYKPDGTFIEPYFFNNAPVHAFIDTQILCEAPEKYIWAGMGDTIAKYYEATISAKGETPEHFKAMGLVISQMCTTPIFENGAAAYKANIDKVPTEEFKETVLAINVSTGLASIMLTRDHTPDYNSGLAHAVFYTLTSVGIEEKHLHGEVVALGVLICLLYDGQTEEFMRVRKFCEEVGLPVRLEDIDISEETMDSLVPMICGMSDVSHYPYKVTPEKLREAIKALQNT